jgi:ribosomal protein L37AE/L43A
VKLRKRWIWVCPFCGTEVVDDVVNGLSVCRVCREHIAPERDREELEDRDEPD